MYSVQQVNVLMRSNTNQISWPSITSHFSSRNCVCVHWVVVVVNWFDTNYRMCTLPFEYCNTIDRALFWPPLYSNCALVCLCVCWFVCVCALFRSIRCQFTPVCLFCGSCRAPHWTELSWADTDKFIWLWRSCCGGSSIVHVNGNAICCECELLLLQFSTQPSPCSIQSLIQSSSSSLKFSLSLAGPLFSSVWSVFSSVQMAAQLCQLVSH